MKTPSKTLASILGLALVAATTVPAAAGGYIAQRGAYGYRGYAPAPYGKVVYRKSNRGGIGAGIAIGALSLLGAAAVASRGNAAPSYSYSDPYATNVDPYRASYDGYGVSGSREFVVNKYRSIRGGIVCETNWNRLVKC